jgi:regulation of enolase protein 1 (concanavalin A-like superfamily)
MSNLIAFDSKQWKVCASSHAANRTSAKGHQLVVESGEKTDWWRTAVGSEPESDVNRTSGPFRYIEVPDSATNWVAGVWISGWFYERFQQATIFLGSGDYANRGAWIKAGIEVEDETHNVG